jgi:ribonuclease T1
VANGTISSWNDAKGFGFIQPNDGKEKVFFHISAFNRASRPTVGLKVTYQLVYDQQNRPKAHNVIAEQYSSQRQKSVPRPKAKTFGAGQLLILASLVLGIFLLFNAMDGAKLFSYMGGDSRGSVQTQDRELSYTLSLIQQGGPFPHAQDGTTFHNRERLLPIKPRGYYREYTVETPGLNHRGARRVVTGGQPPDIYYYTSDHYRSFRQIAGTP